MFYNWSPARSIGHRKRAIVASVRGTGRRYIETDGVVRVICVPRRNVIILSADERTSENVYERAYISRITRKRQ